MSVNTLTHPLDREDCIFCIDDASIGTGEDGIEPERILKEYESWWLILQPLEKRQKTKIAAGYLIVKREVALMSDVTATEYGELIEILPDASATLCEAAGSTYTNQYTSGFNEGIEAGQKVPHAHFQILPVSAEDPAELKVRGGLGGAFEALHASRVPVG